MILKDRAKSYCLKIFATEKGTWAEFFTIFAGVENQIIIVFDPVWQFKRSLTTTVTWPMLSFGSILRDAISTGFSNLKGAAL